MQRTRRHMVKRLRTRTEHAHDTITQHTTAINTYNLSSTPPRCTSRPPTHATPHTTTMYHAIVRKHSNRTTPKPLVAHCAMPIFINHYPPVQPTRHLSSVCIRLTLCTKQHGRFNSNLFHPTKMGYDPLFVEKRVCVAHPTEKVRLQILDRQRWGYQIERCCCR